MNCLIKCPNCSLVNSTRYDIVYQCNNCGEYIDKDNIIANPDEIKEFITKFIQQYNFMAYHFEFAMDDYYNKVKSDKDIKYYNNITEINEQTIEGSGSSSCGIGCCNDSYYYSMPTNFLWESDKVIEDAEAKRKAEAEAKAAKEKANRIARKKAEEAEDKKTYERLKKKYGS